MTTDGAAAQKILNVAEELAQTRGFNGFSYADIAQKLLVTNASIHYHFRTKAELGKALIARYHAAFAHALEATTDGGGDAFAKLRHYVLLYDQVLVQDRMCLCGMLAAEYATLPAPMQIELRTFFTANERWLTVLLQDGRRAGVLTFSGSPKERARLLLGALEGAMLVARTSGDVGWFRSATRHVVEDLRAS